MAANVHVPTRIKVDADTLDHPGLDDALGAATDRALQNAADVLPASRLVTHGPVEVAWTGPGAADVSSATKADVEQRIQAVVATVAKKAPSGRRSSRRPRRWTVVKVVPFRARLGPLVGFFRELGGGLEDVTEVYSGQLDQPVAATARVVQVRSRAVVGS